MLKLTHIYPFTTTFDRISGPLKCEIITGIWWMNCALLLFIHGICSFIIFDASLNNKFCFLCVWHITFDKHKLLRSLKQHYHHTTTPKTLMLSLNPSPSKGDILTSSSLPWTWFSMSISISQKCICIISGFKYFSGRCKVCVNTSELGLILYSHKKNYAHPPSKQWINLKMHY